MTDPRRRSKAPFVNGSVTALLVVVVAVLALQPVNSPPPAIAELSPQPQKQITDAPPEQSSQFGRGATGGECAGPDCGSTTTTLAPVTTPPVTISRARVRRCVGNPPRQIEDPQSPPCVPFWEGDNGGATAKGVTRDEIRIAVPEWNADIHPPMQTFFNNRFEFYGRKLNLIQLQPSGAEPPQQAADGAKADEELKVFASLSGAEGGGYFYHRELVRRQIISTTHFTKASRDEMRRSAPYLWQYPMAYDDIFANLGEWACKRLNGANAVHAGDTALQGRPRRFGIILNLEQENEAIDADALTAELDRCKAPRGEPVIVVEVVNAGAELSDPIIKMQNDGVTSVFCLCHVVLTVLLMNQANNQLYFPEWLLSTYSLGDINYLLSTAPRSQLDNTFGLTFNPKNQRRENAPSYWAQREGNASCCQGETSAFRANADVQYRQLLQLASGIQAAGPRLTPETFFAGLQATTFPNPPHPNMAGAVGFEGGSTAMTLDGAEWWWSSTGRAHYGGTGAMCYVGGGVRHRKGQWPSGGDPFFTGACDSGG